MRIPKPAAVAVAVLAASILPASPAGAAGGPSSSQLRLQQTQIDAVRSQLGQGIADGLQAQLALASAIQANRARQEDLGREVAADNATIAATDARIAALDHQIADLDARVIRERQVLAALARDVYAQPDSIGLALAESSGPADFITRIADMAAAGSRARALKDRLASDEKAAAEGRRQQADARAAQVAARDRVAGDLAKLDELTKGQEASQAQLQAKLAEMKAELSAANVQSAATARVLADTLQAEQAELIAASQQSVWSGLQARPASGAPPGKLRLPIQGATVTQGFGPSACACEPSYGGYAHFHTGIDYAAAAGTPVTAAADGVVIQSASGNGGYGTYVVIAHGGGLNTLYGHLQQAMVGLGQTVAAGSVIGLEGSTGNSTGPHLHFEARVNGVPVDPSTRM